MRRPAVAYLAAAPVTLAALPLAALAHLTGGRVGKRDGVLEASGGWTGVVLERVVPGFPIAAITLGHVVLARDEEALRRSRSHERIHVAQYEKFGFVFPLLYLAASLAAACRGGRLYADNRFEQEAARRSVEAT